MKKGRRAVLWLLAAALCLGLSFPAAGTGANLYLTSINDTIPPLAADTMPFWSGGLLYVPYTVFDRSTNSGIDLGLSCSYTRGRNTVTLYTQHLDQVRILAFDLTTGASRDDITGAPYSARAIIRNGRPYLSLGAVCSFFGLSYTYNALPAVPQGYLVRIKSDAVVLSDAKFIDAAGQLIQRRLREYNQGLSSGVTTPPSSVTPPSSGGAGSDYSVPTYLAFRCQSGESLSAILDALDRAQRFGLFFLTPQVLAEEPGLVLRMAGSGHGIGVLAAGEDAGQTQPLLEAGARLLERTAYLRTTLAWVPDAHLAQARESGWVCWQSTLALPSAGDTGAASFAAAALSRLSGRRRTTYLALEGDAGTARVLPTLLRRLEEEHFAVKIPLETEL